MKDSVKEGTVWADMLYNYRGKDDGPPLQIVDEVISPAKC